MTKCLLGSPDARATHLGIVASKDMEGHEYRVKRK